MVQVYGDNENSGATKLKPDGSPVGARAGGVHGLGVEVGFGQDGGAPTGALFGAARRPRRGGCNAPPRGLSGRFHLWNLVRRLMSLLYEDDIVLVGLDRQPVDGLASP